MWLIIIVLIVVAVVVDVVDVVVWLVDDVYARNENVNFKWSIA